jgi:hypothetical protein
MTLLLFSEAWGKVIDEKKPEAKNLVTLPVKICHILLLHK